MHSIKSFASFDQGVAEIINIVDYLGKYLTDEKGNMITNHNDLVCHLMNIIGSSVPSIENPDYPNTYSFDINSREVSFNIPKSISFGWKSFVEEGGNIIYIFRISNIDFKDRKPSIAVKNIEARLGGAHWEQHYTYEYGKEHRTADFFRFAVRNSGLSRSNRKRESVETPAAE